MRVPVQGSVRQRGLWGPQVPAKPFCRPVLVAKPAQRAGKETPGGAMSLQTSPPERVRMKCARAEASGCPRKARRRGLPISP